MATRGTTGRSRQFTGRFARGFTIVELLVVIGVIGILIALLVPAVQQSREAARRTQCLSNIRQLALALHNYHDAHRVLPYGVMLGGTVVGSPLEPGFKIGVGWPVFILPMIEQQALYQQFDLTDTLWWVEREVNGTGGRYSVRNAPLCLNRVPVFKCPSDPFDIRFWGGHDRAGSIFYTTSMNYAGLADSRSALAPGLRDELTYSGDGVLYNISSVALGDITDGTSQTFLLGEITNGIPDGRAETTATGHDWGVGTIVAAGRGINSPGTVPGDRVLLKDGDAVWGLSSYHSGGANCVFADGSARMISENIDQGVLEALTTRNGAESIGEY